MERLAVALVVLAAVPVAAAPSLPAPVQLPRPPFTHTSQGAAPPPVRVTIVKTSETPNRVIDVARWFQAYNLRWPAVEADRLSRGDRGAIPSEIPQQFHSHRLIRAVLAPPVTLAIYGEDYSGGRYVLGYDASHKRFTFAFDFRHYIVPPEYVSADRQFVDEGVQWAYVAGRRLYVSNFHRTYARSSKGLNGYITAIDLTTATMLWRSPPLVCNTANFLVTADLIITGYGFTAEPDFLYLLSRANGAIQQRARLRSGPEYLALKGDRILVRTYDTNAVFRLKR